MAAKKNLKHWVEYFFFKVFLGIVRLIPLSVANWLGRSLGALAYQLLRPRRELTLENLREAQKRGFLPETLNIQEIGRKTWEHLGMVGSEFIYYSYRPQRLLKNVVIDGETNLRRVLGQNRGVIMAMGHIGNWEIMGFRLCAANLPVNPIAKTQKNSLVDDFINETRHAAGMKPIPKKSFLRPVIQAFQRNEIVPFLMDQNAGRRGVRVDVFGRPAPMPRGTAEFALKTATPVVFAYIVREAKGRHRIVVSEEIALSRSGDYSVDLAANTAKFMELIQATIQKYPEQWLWMHKLWRTNIQI
ncbi:MAG: lysophospholipid acyltransferase family protein [Bacillota bacterium]|jgi:KDO2-lipid IV(A) lauroyltransferase